MNITYTLHAEEQIKERNVIKEWVEETIKSPDKIKSDANKHYATKKLDSHVLKVVYVKQKYIKVITCYFVK